MPPAASSRIPGLVAAAALGLALAGPAMAAPVPPQAHNSFVYRPPERTASGPRTHYVEAPPEWVLDRMAENLKREGFSVAPRDAGDRRLIALYSGDPREFVDCGVVEMLVDGRRERPPKEYSANRPETRTYRMVDGKRIGLLREVRLDARLAVEVEAQGKGTRVTADAIYVLTKTISRVFKGGQPGEALDHEMMSFTSAEIGRFRKGTSCIATGKLEDLPTQGLKKVTALPSGGAEPAPAAEAPAATAP